MSFLESPGSWVDAGSGLLLLGLAVFVLRVAPHRRAHVAFALFSAGLGLNFLIANLPSNDDPLYGPLNAVSDPFEILGYLAACALALLFPRELRRGEVRLLLLPTAAVALLTGLRLATGPPELPTGGFPGPMPLLAVSLRITAFPWALLVLAARHRAAPGEGRDGAQLALMSAGLLMYPGLLAGMVAAFLLAQGLLAGAASIVGLYVLLAALWLREAAASRGPGARSARDVALLALLLPLAGLLLTPALGGYAVAQNAGPLGVARTLMVAVLAYALVRHRLLDADLKVKWTIRQSTVAAAFIGVFFVVSESASSFFATSGLGTYLGIAAAGLLVFALAPLQRAAEKVASAAMPGVKAPSEMSLDERARVFLEAARACWADGNLSRDERQVLDRLRESLNLPEHEAMRLEREAARAPA
jgi:hypothetical protein